MKRLSCPNCGNEVFFDSLRCIRCDTALVLDVEPGGSIRVADMTQELPCANRSAWRCNWLGRGSGICDSCTVVDAGDHHDDRRMVTFTSAQRRALYQLDLIDLPWRWPVGQIEARRGDLQFTYRSGEAGDDVTIGHTGGVISLNLDEANPSTREQIRMNLGEYYRTPLGHLRHELGHFVWMRLVSGHPAQSLAFRDVFGDEQANYAEALAAHYGRRNDGTWAAQHVSYYASAHPWEDFAESFAQVLHVLDVVETAGAWGVIEPPPPIDDATGWISASIEASVTANELARAMGMDDLYPFVLSKPAWAKVTWCWDLLVGPRVDDDAVGG